MIRASSLDMKRTGLQLKLTTLWPHLLAWVSVLLFIATFTWLAIQRHHAFASGFDLGVYNQVVWNTLHGRIFFYTSTGEPLLHLAHHADPILLFFAPFYLIYEGPEMLLFLQAALIGLAGLPLFWLARAKTGSNIIGLSLLLAYLLFPGTQIVTLSDFHPPTMAFGFLMFAFYFLETDRPKSFLLFAILAMACKEQIPLQVVFLGLYAILWKRQWRLGLGTVVLGIVWFVVVMYWVIPANSVTGGHIFLDFYAEFGESPVEIVTTVITRPDLVIKSLWQPAKFAYILQVFAPFAFLSLFGLPVLLIGTPAFAINLLSANPAMHNATRGHYVADVTPWVAFSALFGLIYLSSWLQRAWPQTRLLYRPVLATGLLTTALVWHLFYGFSPLALDRPAWAVTAHDRLGQSLIDRIPSDVPVSAQNRLYAHLSHRTIAYVFPHIFEAEYILLDITADTSPLHPNNQWVEVNKLLESGEFGVLEAADGFLLLQRGLDNPHLPDAFFDFARRPNITPQYPAAVTFGENLRLLGFDLIDDPRREETVARLYWQALDPISDALRLYPFFIDAEGKLIEDTSLRPMITQIWYPPQQWQPGETVVTQTLPWPLGDRWSLAVGVLAGDDWSQWDQRLKVQTAGAASGVRRFETNTWARLASFERQDRALVAVSPLDADLVPPHALQANLDNKLQLLGYDVVQSEQMLTVDLYWEALAAMGSDYTVFVHLLDAQGNPIAQHDGEPWWQLPIPTSTWQPGEKLRDRHELTLPEGVPPGDYRLSIGVYYWQTLERLPTVAGDVPAGDTVDLGWVPVQ